jgi:hypothetical protein
MVRWFQRSHTKSEESRGKGSLSCRLPSYSVAGTYPLLAGLERWRQSIDFLPYLNLAHIRFRTAATNKKISYNAVTTAATTATVAVDVVRLTSSHRHCGTFSRLRMYSKCTHL